SCPDTRRSNPALFSLGKGEERRANTEERIPEVLMNCRTTEWILWAIAMTVFLVLALSGRTMDLGLAIAVVAVLWYVIVPAFSSGRQ
ncbi:MAG: hypothetical protein WCC25_04955, partial [Candidatus Korobacteraceae bacterium]